jgi:hypothetical protein
MNQTVSKQSLDALANTALTAMRIGAESETPRVIYSLNDFGADGAFRELIASRYNKTKSVDRFLVGLSEGFELGSTVAAAIQSNPLDLSRTCDTIEAALDNATPDWGDEYQKAEEAA